MTETVRNSALDLQLLMKPLTDMMPIKNGNFYTYSFVVIKSRLYDFIRRNRKHNNVLPFSYIEESTRVDERLLMSDASGQFEKIEVRQELVSFEKSLKEFGISLEDLVLSSPKHKDSRLLLIKIARIIADDDNKKGTRVFSRGTTQIYYEYIFIYIFIITQFD